MSTEEMKLNSAGSAPLLKITLTQAKQFAELFLVWRLVKSKSEAMRLLKQGAVYAAPGRGENTTLFKIGKRKFIEVIWGENDKFA